MPIDIPQALEEQGGAALAKAGGLRRPGRYLISAMLAGAYIGAGVVLLLTVTGPLSLAHSPATKLVQGAVFGIALTLVVFAGAELSTGNMMTMVIGVFRGRTGPLPAVGVIVFSFAGNLVGSAAFAWLVAESGVLETAVAPGGPAPALTLLTSVVTAKAGAAPTALFVRGILCNFLVCLAVWQAARSRGDGAKLAVIFWCLLAFVGSGFEHVVANMTIFALGMFAGVPAATAGAFAGNMLWVGLGNLVGGGLLVGTAYAVIGRRGTPVTASAVNPNAAGDGVTAPSPVAGRP